MYIQTVQRMCTGLYKFICDYIECVAYRYDDDGGDDDHHHHDHHHIVIVTLCQAADDRKP